MMSAPDVTLSPPRGFSQWARIYFLYRSAFPASERKPFPVIRSMHRQKKTDLWCIHLEGRFAGFAATVNSRGLILLDYLAVSPRTRGQGVGSAALAQLKERYRDRALFVEIESTRKPGPDLAVRQKRKQFYENAGLQPLNVYANVFGVEMELLGWNCRMDFSGYRTFYREQLSPWAAEHITEI